jgi:hypothetical protein
MAFPTAGGYGNLPNGNFSPVIYSKKVQKALRKASVVEDVTNTDYAGEIANFGDSVKIIKEPDITINDYKRGTSLATQDLTDADFTMVVDEANYFQFAIDDIEEAHSHVNFMDLATDRAAYKLRDAFDQVSAVLRFPVPSRTPRQTTTNFCPRTSWTSPTSVAPISALRLRLRRSRWQSAAARPASPARWPFLTALPA